MHEHREHPVLWGLLALVAVAAAVGVLLGVGALGLSRSVGLSGDTANAASDGGSMYLPKPSPTSSSAPASPKETQASEGGGSQPSKPSSSATKEHDITLTAGQQSVAPMAQIDLSGTYPGGNGAILQVQRFEEGTWADFPVTTSVNGEAFSTYIMTGRSGLNRIRVVDTNTGTKSNEVKIHIG